MNKALKFMPCPAYDIERIAKEVWMNRIAESLQ